MAKSKNKNNRKRKKPYPPLSKSDKGIYSALSVLTAISALGAVYGINDIQSLLFFRNENVLAFSSAGSVWAVVPYGIVIISIFIAITALLLWKNRCCSMYSAKVNLFFILKQT